MAHRLRFPAKYGSPSVLTCSIENCTAEPVVASWTFPPPRHGPNLLTANQATATDALGNTTGFSVNTGTLASSTAQAVQGSRSVAATSTGTSAVWVTAAATLSLGDGIPVTGGAVYTAFGKTRRSGTGGADASIYIYWMTAAGAWCSRQSDQCAYVTSTTSGWTLASVTATAPPDAAQAFVRYVNETSVANGDVFYWDELALWAGFGAGWEPPASGAATVIAPSAAATVTANAPTLITGAVAVPPAAAVTATAVAPAVRGGATVIAPAATGAVAALAPTLTAGATVTGTAATISAAAVAPTVSSGATTIAVVATLTVAATAPAVLGGAKVGATVATVTVTAVAPAVTASSGSAVVALAATVTVAASIPTVTAVRTATVVAPAATILADAAAPTVAAIRAATVLAVQALVDVAALAPAVTAAGVTSVGQMERATAPTATVNGAPVPTATVTAQRPAEPVLAGATATAATISGTATATATLERS